MTGKLTTRKFVLTAACLLLTYSALFAGKLTGGETVSLVTMLVGIFATGNVVSKHKAFNEEA